MISSCKKTESPQPASAPRAGFKLYNDGFFIDSTLLLENTSDTLNVTYLWDFGDGITSSEKDPRHSYTKRGAYTIKLTVTNKDNLTASIAYSINVSIGVRLFYYDTNQAIFDVAENSDGNFIVLGYKTVRNQNNAGIYQPFIAKHDDHLRLISLRIGAVQQNLRITNIEQTNDDGFVVGGNFLNNNGSTFSVTKINKLGDVIWTNNYNQSQGMIKEIKSVNDGFILLGEEAKVLSGNTIYSPVILKISPTGQEIWNKHFTDKLYLRTVILLL